MYKDINVISLEKIFSDLSDRGLHPYLFKSDKGWACSIDPIDPEPIVGDEYLNGFSIYSCILQDSNVYDTPKEAVVAAIKDMEKDADIFVVY